ncbi:MAG: TauD/TfdA family dioxygenase [Alphaproteobacteria bacterium]
MASVAQLVEDGAAPPATDYQHFTLEPVTGALGAEVSDIDLATVDGAAGAELGAALNQHLVLFFRDQDISLDQHMALAGHFGTVIDHPYVESLDGHPGIIKIVKEAGEEHNWGGNWHADMTFTAEPPLGAVLCAREIPPWGGDTLFANLQLAYDTLSAGMKTMLDGLSAVHYSGKTTSYAQHYQGMQGRDDVTEESHEHPVVRTHPGTGRKGLFVNRIFTRRLAGMSVEESQPILDFLYDHCERPAFTCRFRWRVNSVAIWDNRAVMHNALSDYHPSRMGQGFRRVLHRATIAGDKPY